ncbi:MAG: hypothetical protein ACJ790_21035 [Myxococcaceae bacterium]
MHPRPTRRQIIQWLGAAALASGVPLGCGGKKKDEGSPGPSYAFFNADEAALFTALGNTVLPSDPDGTPGGGDLGAAVYADMLLSAFESNSPIFRAGPYSGREPNPDGHGGASADFPENGFLKGIPLNRVTERAWRLYLYGSDGVEGGGPNDAVLGKIVGLRDQVRNGLAAAKDSLGADFAGKPLAERFAAFKSLDAEFRETVITLVSQAAWAAPEYGGNKDLQGWALIHLEGESQPLGYSLFDETTGEYKERDDKPVSRADTTPDPAPMDSDTRAIIQKAVIALGGRVA